MENKLSVVAIMISDAEAVEKVNLLLHEYREYIAGRMGLPYRDRGVSVITLVIDAPIEKINGLSGKLGMIKGVTSKVMVTK
jgi:putative iron-only hydrogenase system regulator